MFAAPAPGYVAPSPRVLSAWRTSTGPGPLEYLRDKVLTAALTEHSEHDWRAVRVGDLHLRSADGTLTRVPDTPANRSALGSSGTADDSAPYPQVRGLALNDVSTRSLFAMPYGASGGSKPDAEQKLLDKAMDEYPYLFTMDARWLFDRNFPGAPRVARLIKKTHVLIRVKSDIPLKRVAFLLDRSWQADLAGGEGKDRVTVRVRVIEYWVTVEGQDVPEMFCLITDLLDGEAYPARVLAAACRWRWDGSETGLRETKSLLDGADPSTGPMLRSRSPLLVRQELAAWALAGELVRGLVRDAAHAAAPARKGRRAGQPVHPRQLSFTAARRAAITSIRQGTAAAGLPAAAVAAGTARLLAATGVPGTSPTGTGTAPATPKPGRHSRRHTATPRPGSPKRSWTSAARPPDQGKPASPCLLRKASRLPDPAAPARHADCSADSAGLPAPRSIRLMSACVSPVPWKKRLELA